MIYELLEENGFIEGTDMHESNTSVNLPDTNTRSSILHILGKKTMIYSLVSLILLSTTLAACGGSGNNSTGDTETEQLILDLNKKIEAINSTHAIIHNHSTGTIVINSHRNTQIKNHCSYQGIPFEYVDGVAKISGVIVKEGDNIDGLTYNGDGKFTAKDGTILE